jgi:hypothetical protein
MEALVASHWMRAIRPPRHLSLDGQWPSPAACKPPWSWAPAGPGSWLCSIDIQIGTPQIAGEQRCHWSPSPRLFRGAAANGTPEHLSRRVEARAMYDILDGDRGRECTSPPPACGHRICSTTCNPSRKTASRTRARRASLTAGVSMVRACLLQRPQLAGPWRTGSSMRQANTRLAARTVHCHSTAQGP